MKENFAAWTLDPAAFDDLPPADRLAFLVRFAVLAPSSHNSQPWKFVVEDEAVTVAPDMARALPQSDANHRQLYLSIGCATENLCAAADYYGYQTEVARSETGGAIACRVRVIGTPSSANVRAADHVALAIPRRRTNRNAYDARPPEAAFLDMVRGLATPELRVDVLLDEEARARSAAIVSDALIEAMDSTGFRHELSHYVRNNVTAARTGMPMYGFGMPTPPSFLAPALVRRFNVNRMSRKQDEELIRRTPAHVILSTREDGPDAWIHAGRTFERVAIEAERRGISTGPLAAAIQIGDHFKNLQSLLATDFRPQVFFRAGYATKAPAHSPRIPASEVTASVKNQV
jgi:nitroreductase